VAEYERLLEAYPALGCEVVVLPKVSVAERADFVLGTLVA
jgi:predicted ATPase